MVTEHTDDDVLINEQLDLRAAKPVRTDLELTVFRYLVQRFSTESAELLNDTVDAVCEVTGADSAGITLLDRQPDGTDILRWVATAGRITELPLQALPRTFSPCGTVLDRGEPQLFSYPGRFFTCIPDSWDIVELLLVPWRIGDSGQGILWALMQCDARKFDREDLWTLQNLVVFASAAVARSEAETPALKQAPHWLPGSPASLPTP